MTVPRLEVISLAEIMKRPLPEVPCKKRRGSIVLTGGGYDYEVDLKRCSSYAEIVHWCRHLSAKTWVTAAVLGRFIEIACAHHGLDPWGDE